MSADENQPKSAGESKSTSDEEETPPERTVVTRGAIDLGGKRIEYVAKAGTVNLLDAKGKARASLFYVSYEVEGPRHEERPVTFCFNGGPGSSSVWLHLGAWGPKRVAFPDPHAPPPPPYSLVDNDATILDVTDLVFVDPVGTGFSRIVGKGEDSEFYGPRGDVESVAELIRIWTTRNRRWNSPRYVAGESYGGTRVAALAPYLADRGVFLNGVVLVSPALDFAALEFGPDNDLPSVLYLPTYAATAWYHGALARKPKELAPFLDEVRELAFTRYAPALLRGARLPEAERRALIDDLARVTGLSPGWLDRNDLRIDNGRFAKELLSERGLVVGRLDARYTGRDLDRGRDSLLSDPSFAAPHGPYAALMNDYLRRTLEYEDDRPYEILNFKVNESWKWELPKGKTGGFLNVVAELRRAMLDNPHLRVFFASGIYDMATPFFAAEHAASHLGSEPHVRANIVEAFYESGHMMYLHAESRAKLRGDLVSFYGR